MKKYKIKQHFRYYFTLLELLVSMTVFTVLMMALMQFVNSAQKLWSGVDQKNSLYGNARIALDFMAKDIQSAFYEWDKVPFFNDTTNKRICFVSMSDYLPTGCSSRLVETQYYLDATTKKLMISRIGDNSGSTYWNFYRPNNSMNDAAVVFGNSFSDTGQVTTSSIQPVIPYVTELTFTCFDNKFVTLTDEKLMPYAVKIDMTLLDKNTYEKWVASGASTSADIYVNNKRCFSRIVIIGNRGQFVN